MTHTHIYNRSVTHSQAPLRSLRIRETSLLERKTIPFFLQLTGEVPSTLHPYFLLYNLLNLL